MNKILLSLCIPTNGVSEWVFPVLDSIYNQNADEELFEVVITDNGQNVEFKTKINEFAKLHNNIVYKETNALPFLNEIESYKIARGELIKFVNHRTRLVDGTISKFFQFIKKNYNDKPILYFSNGVLNLSKTTHEYDSFDMFVKNLSYWSSWSTGMTIWKSDFEKLTIDVSEYNELFPHTDILFYEKKRGKYIINNEIIFDEIPVNGIPKAKYDLFYAFAVEYPGILIKLLMNKCISVDTFNNLKRDILDFIVELYIDYIIKKNKCSYDLSSFDESIKVFYSKREFKKNLYKKVLKNILKRRNK